jgi:inhibitor of the pro-sigma K processing machinery
MLPCSIISVSIKNFKKTKILGKNSKMKSSGISFCTSFRYFIGVAQISGLAAEWRIYMESIIFIGVIIACVIFIVICLIRRRPDLIVDFGLRACIGTAGIYILDMILKSKGYGINVGINGASVLTNGLLGLPGFLMLYGLAVYYSSGK